MVQITDKMSDLEKQYWTLHNLRHHFEVRCPKCGVFLYYDYLFRTIACPLYCGGVCIDKEDFDKQKYLYSQPDQEILKKVLDI